MFEFINGTQNQREDGLLSSGGEDSEKAFRHSEIVAREVLTHQRQIEHLTLLCQSMWEVLHGQIGLSDSELRAKVTEVDSRDGKIDGEISQQVFACPRCGKNCNSSNKICIMCGEDLLLHKPNIFEG
jgi:hypothetical protein